MLGSPIVYVRSQVTSYWCREKSPQPKLLDTIRTSIWRCGPGFTTEKQEVWVLTIQEPQLPHEMPQHCMPQWSAGTQAVKWKKCIVLQAGRCLTISNTGAYYVHKARHFPALTKRKPWMKSQTSVQLSVQYLVRDCLTWRTYLKYSYHKITDFYNLYLQYIYLICESPAPTLPWCFVWPCVVLYLFIHLRQFTANKVKAEKVWFWLKVPIPAFLAPDINSVLTTKNILVSAWMFHSNMKGIGRIRVQGKYPEVSIWQLLVNFSRFLKSWIQCWRQSLTWQKTQRPTSSRCTRACRGQGQRWTNTELSTSTFVVVDKQEPFQSLENKSSSSTGTVLLDDPVHASAMCDGGAVGDAAHRVAQIPHTAVAWLVIKSVGAAVPRVIS